MQRDTRIVIPSCCLIWQVACSGIFSITFILNIINRNKNTLDFINDISRKVVSNGIQIPIFFESLINSLTFAFKFMVFKLLGLPKSIRDWPVSYISCQNFILLPSPKIHVIPFFIKFFYLFRIFFHTMNKSLSSFKEVFPIII